MIKNYTVGIDLGGTNIMTIVIDAEGEVLARAKTATPDLPTVANTAAAMRSTAEKALAKCSLDLNALGSVGVAVPSSVDPESGLVLHAPNLGWKNEDALGIFTHTFEREVALENDVNCGMLGEYHYGAARGAKNALCYFVGTGLGGGIIINGRLYRGLRGGAAELGHEIIRHKGRLCNCGNRGCVEAYCSKVAFCKAFEKQIGKKGRSSVMEKLMDGDFTKIKSKMLVKGWNARDKVVRKVLKKGFRMLGLATANMMSVLAPDRIVYGGGVIEALGNEMMPYIREGMRSHLFALQPEDVDLRLSELGDDAVPLGAAALAIANQNEKSHRAS